MRWGYVSTYVEYHQGYEEDPGLSVDLALDLDHKGRCCDSGKSAGQERKRLGNVGPLHGPDDLLVGEQTRVFTQTLTNGHCREDGVHNRDELGQKSAKSTLANPVEPLGMAPYPSPERPQHIVLGHFRSDGEFRIDAQRHQSCSDKSLGP